jgi:hypothetical protein
VPCHTGNPNLSRLGRKLASASSTPAAGCYCIDATGMQLYIGYGNLPGRSIISYLCTVSQSKEAEKRAGFAESGKPGANTSNYQFMHGRPDSQPLSRGVAGFPQIPRLLFCQLSSPCRLSTPLYNSYFRSVQVIFANSPPGDLDGCTTPWHGPTQSGSQETAHARQDPASQIRDEG